MPETRSDWSATVRLPATDFPMRGDLAKKEPERLKFWEDLRLYERLRERQAGRPPFVLHDGPPYANGLIHIGHALDKILKDVTIKSRALMGRATPYRPGWDCHGLPIETALLKELKMSKRGVTDAPKFRRDAAAFARRFIALQTAEFKRLGVLGDWDRPYTTMDPGYEAEILRAFRLLVRQGLVYRGLKPVLWCVSCETALAEAEVEYKEKTSPSVYVGLPVVAASAAAPEAAGAEILVWTTTPWTLPANVAAAFSPKLTYVLARATVAGRERRLILAEGRLAAVAQDLGASSVAVLRSWPGAALDGAWEYERPYGDSGLTGPRGRCLLADHVTADEGTGVVHTSPGHGEDDFAAGQAHGLEILNPVDGAGRFTEDAPRWTGRRVFEEGNPAIVADLAERGFLLARKDVRHSYPHCWRCKNPVIFRTTEQWFLRLDEGLRRRLLDQVEAVRWVPPEGRNRIAAMISSRPDWCLSRQRVWGAPIPVLYSAATGKPVLDDAVLEAVQKRAEKEGADFWFERWGETLARADWPFLPPHPDLDGGFRRETDILDVWFDSGVSWLAVLGEDATADLYSEGSDQHRGWFQSSLVMSTALRGRAPYKAVFTHGFVLDEKGRAMHKSAGNVVAPQDVIAKWGADVLRLWAALSDFHEDVRISDKLMEVPAESYRRVRNTLRYLLGNLADFDPRNAAPFSELPELERYVLHRLADIQEQTLADYEGYRYRHAARRLTDYCAFDLSAFYLDAMKDRLYTFRADAPERLAAQTVMAEIFSRLCALLAPLLSFTAEEAWGHWARKPAPSVFLWDLPPAASLPRDPALAARWGKILAVRSVAQKALEEARAAKRIGASLQAKVVLRGPAEELKPLEVLNLPELLIVSEAALSADGGPLRAEVSSAAGAKCPRCWRRQTDLGLSPSYPELCGRCARQL
ncbi:MAG: isoleucine--tRNA ligase [Elusimicrobia bacterium]|nr:isoleucine--tRNA ligase [Elusimicrobiota bacterium]